MKAGKLTLIASSPTLIGLAKMLNKYYYSTSYQVFPDLTVTNSRGVYEKVVVKKKKSKYYAYEK